MKVSIPPTVPRGRGPGRVILVLVILGVVILGVSAALLHRGAFRGPAERSPPEAAHQTNREIVEDPVRRSRKAELLDFITSRYRGPTTVGEDAR